MNGQYLYTAIYQTLEESLQQIKATTINQHLCAIGLGLVEDLCGFFCVGTTIEQFSTFDEVGQAWWISEWDYGSKTNQQVHDTIYHMYQNLGEDDQEEQYLALRTLYENSIIRAIQALRAEGKLQNHAGKELIVMLQYADAFDEQFQDRSFPQMNPLPLVEVFKLRFERNMPQSLAILKTTFTC